MDRKHIIPDAAGERSEMSAVIFLEVPLCTAAPVNPEYECPELTVKYGVTSVNVVIGSAGKSYEYRNTLYSILNKQIKDRLIKFMQNDENNCCILQKFAPAVFLSTEM